MKLKNYLSIIAVCLFATAGLGQVTVSPLFFTVNDVSASYSFNIKNNDSKNNVSFSVSVSSGSSWITINGTGTSTTILASGSKDITFTCAKNTGALRTGTIDVYINGAKHSNVIITQNPPNPTLSISTDKIVSNNYAATYQIQVTSNASWDTEIYYHIGSGWLSLSPAAESFDKTVKINTTNNTSSGYRWCTINFKINGVVKAQVTVNQEGTTPIVSVSPSSLNFSASGGNKTFNITSSAAAPWNVTSEASWATVSPDNGKNNGTITVTASANTTTSQRTATIRVTCSDTYDRFLTVTQDPAAATNPALSGTVSISGTAVFGQTLTAVTSALFSTPSSNNPSGFSYQWLRGGSSISGATQSTYTLVQADINNAISVKVSASNCTGSITSGNTATVSKASQSAPDAPTFASATTSSITLNAVSGCEYRRGSNSWQTGTSFTGLSQNTEYSFSQRRVETATHLASPASSSANFTTQGSTGIDDIDFPDLKVFPNPFSDMAYVVNAEGCVLKVINITGALVHTQQITSSKETLQMAFLPKGVYFFRFEKDGLAMVVKVVVSG